MKLSSSDLVSGSYGLQSPRRAVLQLHLLSALIGALLLSVFAALSATSMNAPLLMTMLLLPVLTAVWFGRAYLPDWALQTGVLLFVLAAVWYGVSVTDVAVAAIAIGFIALLVIALSGGSAMRWITAALSCAGLVAALTVLPVNALGTLVAVLLVGLCAGLMITASILLLQRQARVQFNAQQQAELLLGERERVLVDFRQRNEAFRRRLEKEAEQKSAQLQRANRDLREANAHLESFNYMVSHDIRASLRILDGLAKVLVEDIHGNRSVAALQNLSRLQSSIGNMQGMVQELLSMSRSGQYALCRRKVDMAAIMRDLVSDRQIAEPQRRVTVEVADTMYACAQPDLMREVLQNLLGNAWKFTAQRADAHIEFGVTDGVTDDSGPVFYVRDNGVGFDMQRAAEMFKPFTRLHADQGYEGSGVGLASVKRIIERHGGRVWALAEPGGTKVCFTLGALSVSAGEDVASVG